MCPVIAGDEWKTGGKEEYHGNGNDKKITENGKKI